MLEITRKIRKTDFRMFKCWIHRCFSTSSLFNSLSIEKTTRVHVPVLPTETVAALEPKDGQLFIDMTFGGGGHSELLLNSADIKLLALDRDPHAHELAKTLAEHYKNRLIPLLGKFSDLPRLLTANNIEPNSIDGILFDAGCSSMQLDTPTRGFALSKDGPLDMRMDADRIKGQPSAADVVNTLEVDDLAKIFKVYGDEKYSKKIARSIVETRYLFRPLRTTQELSELVSETVNREPRLDKLQRPAHPATKVFQALRIFVNNELNELNYGMVLAYMYLKTGGRLVTLSFHSLEDRIFKRYMMGIDIDEPISSSLSQKFINASVVHEKEDILDMLNKKYQPVYNCVITPSIEEVESNPRSRSAKLRAAMKIT